MPCRILFERDCQLMTFYHATRGNCLKHMLRSWKKIRIDTTQRCLVKVNRLHVAYVTAITSVLFCLTFISTSYYTVIHVAGILQCLFVSRLVLAGCWRVNSLFSGIVNSDVDAAARDWEPRLPRRRHRRRSLAAGQMLSANTDFKGTKLLPFVYQQN